MKKARRSFGEPYECLKEWPEDCGVQCGGNGVVLTEGSLEKALTDPDEALSVLQGKKTHYRTAFFEAFPKVPSCFIRGEGETVEAAEESAWNKYQKIISCNHEMERRDRKDGYGYCKHCTYSSMVFEPLNKCCKCNIPTNYTCDYKGRYYCKKHSRCKPKSPKPTFFDIEKKRLPRVLKKRIRKSFFNMLVFINAEDKNIKYSGSFSEAFSTSQYEVNTFNKREVIKKFPQRKYLKP